jgi:hypothetical protein
MSNLFLVARLADQRLTQAAMRRFVFLSSRRIGKPDSKNGEKNHELHRHENACPFSYSGLCDPGDLNHQILT